MITKNFTIALTDEPYLGTTTQNKTYAATYNGPKYIRLQYDVETKYVEKYIYVSDSMEEMNSYDSYVREPGKATTVLDATVNTFEAAYVTGMYDTGAVDPFTCELGTVDDANEPETWEYVWDQNTGMIAQQYYGLDLKFENGAYVRPRFRVHALTRQSFLDSMVLQAANIGTALETNENLTDVNRAKLEAYKTWLENIPTKYANVSHWKIPFKHEVPQY
jgi:hypothetical protein